MLSRRRVSIFKDIQGDRSNKEEGYSGQLSQSRVLRAIANNSHLGDWSYILGEEQIFTVI